MMRISTIRRPTSKFSVLSGILFVSIAPGTMYYSINNMHLTKLIIQKQKKQKNKKEKKKEILKFMLPFYFIMKNIIIFASRKYGAKLRRGRVLRDSSYL